MSRLTAGMGGFDDIHSIRISKKAGIVIIGVLLILLGWIAPALPQLFGARYRETAVFLPLVLTVIRPVVVLIGAVVLIGTAVLFGIPGWAPGDRKPDRETLGILAVIFALIFLAIAGYVLL